MRRAADAAAGRPRQTGEGMKSVYLFPLASLFVAMPAAAQEFEGVRIEGRLGYDWVSLDSDFDDGLVTTESDSSEDGFVFGAEAGYDFGVAPGLIVGVYGGIDLSDADFCRAVGEVDEACLELRRNLYAGLRVGGQIMEHTLIYGKAGYTNGQARIDFNDVDDVLDDLIDSGSRDGWHFGLGVEQNFGSMFYGKLEFVHTMYSDIDFANADFAVALDSSRSQLVAGFGLRF
jgi:outer membrane immunogenic protein